MSKGPGPKPSAKQGGEVPLAAADTQIRNHSRGQPLFPGGTRVRLQNRQAGWEAMHRYSHSPMETSN